MSRSPQPVTATMGVTDLLFHSPPTALVSVLPPPDVPKTRVADQVYVDELTGDVVTLSSYETKDAASSPTSATAAGAPQLIRRSCEARFYGNPVVPLEGTGSCGSPSASSLQNDRETYQRTNYLITSITLATTSSKPGSSAKNIVAARRFPRPVQVRTATGAAASPTATTASAGGGAADAYELRYLIALSMDDQTIHFYITPPAFSVSENPQPISVGSYTCSPNTLRFRQSSYPIRGFQWCPNSTVSDHWRQHQSTRSSRGITPESLAELTFTATAAHSEDPTDVWSNANRSFYYRSKVLLGGGGYAVPPPPETGDLPIKKLLKSLQPSARAKANTIYRQACGALNGEATDLAETALGVSLSSAVEQLHTCLQRDQLLMVWTEIGVDLVYVNFTRDSATGVSAAQKRDDFEHLASPMGSAKSSSNSGPPGGSETSGVISPSVSGCTGMLVVLRRLPTKIDFWTTLPNMHVSLVINSSKSTNVKPIAELGAYTWIMPQFKIPGLNPITPAAAPRYRSLQCNTVASKLPQSYVANMQFPTAGPHLATNMLFPASGTDGHASSTYATGPWSQTAHSAQLTQPHSYYPLQMLSLHDELYIAFVDYTRGHVVLYRYQHNNHSGRTADLGVAMLSDDYGDRYTQWAQANSTVTTNNRAPNPSKSGASTLIRYYNSAVDNAGISTSSSFATAERRAGGGPDAVSSLPGAADLLRQASDANLTTEEKEHIMRIASEAAAAIAEDVQGLEVEGLKGSDGHRGNVRRLQVASKLQPLSDYAADAYRIVDQEFQVGSLLAEGQPMPTLPPRLPVTEQDAGASPNVPLPNLAAGRMLGRGIQGVANAASSGSSRGRAASQSGQSTGRGVPLPCAFLPIPDVISLVTSALEKGVPTASTTGPLSNADPNNANVARPPTMGLSSQQPGAGASSTHTSVLTSKGTSCYVSCFPSARGVSTSSRDSKGFVPSDPSASAGSISAAGEQQEGSAATFVVAYVLPLPAHSIVSALRAEWYFGADVQAVQRWSDALRNIYGDPYLCSPNTPVLPPYPVILQTTVDGLLLAHIPDDGKLAQEVRNGIANEDFDPLFDVKSDVDEDGADDLRQQVSEEVLRPCHLVASYDVKLAMLKDEITAANAVLAQQHRGLAPMDSSYYSSVRQQQIASTAVSTAGRFVAQHAGLFHKQLFVVPFSAPTSPNTTNTLTPVEVASIEALENYEQRKTTYLASGQRILSDFNGHASRAQCTRYLASYTSHFSYHRLAPFSPIAFAELRDQIEDATTEEAARQALSANKGGPSRKIVRRLHRATIEGKAQWMASLMAARLQELSNQRAEGARRTVEGVQQGPSITLYTHDGSFQELANAMKSAVAAATGNDSSSTARGTMMSQEPSSKRGTMRPSGKGVSSLASTIAAVEARQSARLSTARSSAGSNAATGEKKGWFRSLFNRNRDDDIASGPMSGSGADGSLLATSESTDVHEGVPIVHHLPLWCLEAALPNSILEKMIQSPRAAGALRSASFDDLCSGSTRVVVGTIQPRLLNSWSTPTAPSLGMLGDLGVGPVKKSRGSTLDPSANNASYAPSRPPPHIFPPSYRFVSTVVGYNAMAIVRSFGMDHEAMWSWWPMAIRRLMLVGSSSVELLDELDAAEKSEVPKKVVNANNSSSKSSKQKLAALPPMSATGGVSCPRSRLPFGVYDALCIFAVQFLLNRRTHTVVTSTGDPEDIYTPSQSRAIVIPLSEIVTRVALHTALTFESLSLVGRIFDVVVAHQRCLVAECSWFNFWSSRWKGSFVEAPPTVSLVAEATQGWRVVLESGFLAGSTLHNVMGSSPDVMGEFVRYVRSLYQPHLWPITTSYHIGGGSTRREMILTTYAGGVGSSNVAGSNGEIDALGACGIEGQLGLYLVRPAIDAGHMYHSVFEELLRVAETCRAMNSRGALQAFGPAEAHLDGSFVRNYVLHCFFEYARSLVQHGLSLSVPLQSSLIDLMLSTAKPLPAPHNSTPQQTISPPSTPPATGAVTVISNSDRSNQSTAGQSPVSSSSQAGGGNDHSASTMESAYFRLHQLLMYRALEDHVPTALQLISLQSEYPPAFQLGLDILSRLKAHSEIIMVFLSKGMPLRAAKHLLSLKRDTISAFTSLSRQLARQQTDKDEDPTGEGARRTHLNLQSVSQQLYPSNADLFSVVGILDSAATMHDAELRALGAEEEVTLAPVLPEGEEDTRTERQRTTVYLKNRLITKRKKYRGELGQAGAQFYSIYTLVVTQYVELAVRSRSEGMPAVGATQLLLHFPSLKPFKTRYDLICSGNIHDLYKLVAAASAESA